MYEALKTLHLIGVILLVGNVTVSAVWKVFADRTKNAFIIAHAQNLITLTDWSLTSSGIVMIIVGGYGAAYVGGDDVLRTPWLIWGQLLFGVSGLIWVLILIPLQIRLSRLSKAAFATGQLPETYLRLNLAWLAWGIAATVPLVAAVLIMVEKPSW